MKRVKVTFAIFLIFAGFLYLNPPGCYQLCELLKEAINWANLMINYCFCQAFSHWECGWQGPLYVAIHTILFIWWCYRVVKAKRIKVRRRMERQKRKKRVELRVLRLIAWLNDGYARKSPKLKPDDAPGEEEEPPGQWMDRFSRREFDIKPEPRFSRNYWRSWSTPPYVGLNQPKN